MPNAIALLNDVFTFLWHVRAAEMRPPQSRFLAPGRVAQINAHLSQPLSPAPRRERDHLHLSFIHFLCEATRLIGPMDGALRPTLHAAQWLAATPQQQLQAFVDVLLRKDDAIDALWRAYRLPGCHWIHPRESLLRCIALLRERAGGRYPFVSLRAIARHLPIPLDEAKEAQPPAVAKQLVALLEALGLVERRGASQRWLALPDWPVPCVPCNPCFFDGEDVLVAPIGAHWPALLVLADYATLEAAVPARRIRFSEARLHEALQQGHDLPALFAAIETLLAQPLPDAFFQQIQAWSQRFGRLWIRQAILLESRDETLLQGLMRIRRMRSCVKPLTSKVALVQPDQVRTLIGQLTRRGHTPRVLLPATPRPAKQFEQPAQAQLYVAAQTCHLLAGWLPDACVPPLSVIQALEAQISPADIAVAKAFAEAGAAQMLQTNHRGDDEVISPASHEDVLNATARAISERAPLHILYRGRDDVAPVARLVEPMRMEWQNGIAYLIAWCHLAGGQRTFRLDRIMGFDQSNTTPALAPPAHGQSLESS